MGSFLGEGSFGEAIPGGKEGFSKGIEGGSYKACLRQPL